MKKNYNQPKTEIVCIAPANMIMSVSGMSLSGGGGTSSSGDVIGD